MNKFLTVACAATLLSTSAFAGERQVKKEVPKTITVTCSDNVQPGTVVLSNPPKFSCADYDVVNRIIGTGITVGPDTKISRILRAVRGIEKSSRTATVTRPPVAPRRTRYDDGSNQPMFDFNERFPGFSRNQEWFKEHYDQTAITGDRSRPRYETKNCSGFVNLSDLLNGKCGDARIRVDQGFGRFN
jgi:hypothetical protein